MHVFTHTCTHADIYIYACSYTHVHTHVHAHTYNMYICKHASTPGTTALQRLREELMQTPEAPHRLFRSTQPTTFRTCNARTSLYPLPETPTSPSPPSPLTNIPQNSSRTAAIAVSLFHTDQHNKVNNSEEVPRSFTMAPCVVVEILEGKQRCSRAPAGEQDAEPENAQSDCSRETKGQQRTTKPSSSPSHHNDRAPPRQHPLICIFAKPMHPVHGLPKLLATEAIPQNEVTFLPFSRGFQLQPIAGRVAPNLETISKNSQYSTRRKIDCNFVGFHYWKQ